MELRHLRYFLAVAEELNFRRAADRLQMAQPPLSRQIRDLELEMGVKLLERNQRNVLLTKAGKAFLRDVKILLHQVDQAIITAQKIHQNSAEKITIGFSRAASYQVLPQMLSQLGEHTLELELIEMESAQQLLALEQQQIDMAIGYLPLKLAGAGWIGLRSETLMAALPQNHPLAAAHTLYWLDLKHQSLILPPQLWDRTDGERKAFLETLKGRGIEGNGIQEVGDRETALAFVGNALGITIIPSSMCHLEIKGVVYKGISETWESLEIGAVWRDKKNLGGIKVLLNALEKVALEIQGDIHD
jgi:DNA-binding transcriptional LysR family regulator